MCQIDDEFIKISKLPVCQSSDFILQHFLVDTKVGIGVKIVILAAKETIDS